MAYRFHKLPRPACAALALSLCLTACGGPPAEKPAESARSVQVEETKEIGQTRPKDKSALYQNNDPYDVISMYLTVRRGNDSDNTNHSWEEVNTYSTYYYDENNLDRYKVEGLLQVGDETGPLPGELGYQAMTPNATVQIRGKTTSRAQQKSYKIRLMKDKGMWRDQRTIILNKHIFDTLRFRNKLSYDMMTRIPDMVSARTQFVHLYVKDQTGEGAAAEKFADYGLYTQVEQMNTRYLRNHGLDESGQLYKAEMFEFMPYEDSLKLKTDPDYDQKAFEKVLEIKGSDDHTKLLRMLEELNNYALPIEEVFGKYFDEDNYFTWLAFQMLTGNPDVVTQNFYLYSPLNSQKWYFISWDNDGAWGYGKKLAAGQTAYNYETGISQFWGCVLHQRVLKNENYRKKLDQKVQMVREILTKDLLADCAEKYHRTVRPFLTRMPDNQYSGVTAEGMDGQLPHIPDEIEYNYQLYLESLVRPMPFYVTPPQLSGGRLQFIWNAAYDLAGGEIAYKFELASDYQFGSLIYSEEGLSIPQVECGQLPAGQYFFRVTAKNVAGKEQTAMEKYIAADDKEYLGISMFYVLPDGAVGVD